MDCIPRASALIPVANASLPANETTFSPPDFAWIAYLVKDPSDGPLFNDSATLEVARHSLESCREWDNVCQDPSQIFVNPTNLGVCLLYPNLTAAVNDSPGRTAATQGIESLITTCLISYCALGLLCSSYATNCSTSSLITASGHLSSQGVGRCWSDICKNLYPYVNSDIGGVGVC